VTAKAGGLRTLTNAFINAGGEVEKRKKLATLQSLGVGTYGLAGVDNKLYVFGTLSPGSVSVTPPVYYQQLVPAPSLGLGVTIDRILDVDVFAATLYTVVRFTDGTVRHFYGSAQVAGQGTAARTFKTKVYAAEGANVRFSAVNAPNDWAGTGSGLIDVTAQDAGSADIIGLENYYNYLALLGRRSIQLWSMAADPAQNQYIQTLSSTGLFAPNGAARYGNGDVLFLSDTGIRSIRARDSSNAAVLNDIGSPIDSLVIARRLSMSQTDAERIRALTDPLSGHFWLIWGSTVYVLAYYPATKVTAWSTYELGFTADYAAVAGNRIAIRTGDTIYLYGGADGDTYPGDDEQVVTVELPFIGKRKPASEANWDVTSAAVTNEWHVYVLPDPNDESAEIDAGVFSNVSFHLARNEVGTISTHVAARMTCRKAGAATLSALVFNFQDARETR